MSHVCLMSAVMEQTAPTLGLINALKKLGLFKKTNNRTGYTL